VNDYRTLTQIVRAARSRLRPYAWNYVVGGSETETTLRRNRAAIERLAFVPRVLRNVEHVDTATTLLGTALRIPYILAPIGSLQDVWPEGSAAQVGGACTFGTLPVVSSVTQPSLEDAAAAASGDKWFQLYVRGDIDWIAAIVRRVRESGYRALVMTVDVAHYSNRERQFLHDWVPDGRRGADGPQFQARLDWDVLARIIEFAGIPVIVKGIQMADDAAKALAQGVAAVWVSNHGGRQLDAARASLDVLPEVVAAIGGRVPVIVDGGFSRGTDVIKALALGADVVAGGRLHAWALGAGGAPAVGRMLELLEEEIVTTMALLGVTSLAELDPTFVVRDENGEGAMTAFPLLDLTDEQQPGAIESDATPA
jgi:glycolate oxidase